MSKILFLWIAKMINKNETLTLVQSSYVLKYSPVSAWLKITTPVGYISFVWRVPLAATPKPKGKSFKLKIQTGAYCGML